MRNEFRNKLCAYCGKAEATTDDHVIARTFFLENRRANLPKIPACEKCNGEKAKLELYLTAVLPFGGRHVDVAVNLQTKVPKRLENNAKLRRSLVEGFTGEKIPLESGRIEELFTLITKGLLYHHWQIVLGDDDCAATTVILDAGSAFLDHIFKMNARGRIKESLGEGTFIYEGVQATDYPQFTLWRFSMYGVQFGDADKPEEKPSIIFSTTGPRSLLPTFWKTALGEVLVPA